jgi:hypothetical protein
VETEQLVAITADAGGSPDKQPLIYSHVQIRGSIPLFWRQVVNARYKPRLELIDSPQTLDALRTHLEALKSIYGDLLIFNLVDKKGGELIVGSAMTNNIGRLNDERLK